MGAIWLLGMPTWLRVAGVEVHEYPGWELRSRSSGGFDRIQGIVIHHDGAPSWMTEARRTQLEAVGLTYSPVGNLHIHRDGSVTVIAAGASNTAGRGGPAALSQGTIGAHLANRETINIEASNDGVGQPWTPAQTATYIAVCAALCRRFGLDPRRDIISHREWTQGVPYRRGPRKIDPAGPAVGPDLAVWGRHNESWTMDTVRASVAHHINTGDEMRNITPTRVIDTRGASAGVPDGGGMLRAGAKRRLPVAYAHSAYLHFTVVSPVTAGYLSVSPDGKFGGTSVVNFTPGEVAHDGVPVDTPDGHVWVQASADCHLIIDVYAQGV